VSAPSAGRGSSPPGQGGTDLLTAYRRWQARQLAAPTIPAIPDPSPMEKALRQIASPARDDVVKAQKRAVKRGVKALKKARLECALAGPQLEAHAMARAERVHRRATGADATATVADNDAWIEYRDHGGKLSRQVFVRTIRRRLAE